MESIPCIDMLGGQAATATKLTEAGYPTSRQVVHHWNARGRIPGNVIPRLMKLFEAEGIAFTSDDFVVAARRRKRA